MSADENTDRDLDEGFDPKAVSNLAKLGWIMPQSDAAVRAAEEFVAASPTELPTRLPDVLGAGREQLRSGILERYLRPEGRGADPGEDRKARSEDTPRRDLDRE